jgi:hypothetical protein
MIFYFILYQPYKVLQNRQMIKNIDTGYCTISNKFAYSNKKGSPSNVGVVKKSGHPYPICRPIPLY